MGWDVEREPWYEFVDDEGKHWASPDLVCFEKRVIFECKLTHKAGAKDKLLNFYAPVVKYNTQDEWACVQVVRHLTPSAKSDLIQLSDLQTLPPYGVLLWRP